jgi:carbonic anhydrase
LKAGNERFATGQPMHPNQSVELRESTAEDQNPFIGVLACADSRVIPELIFDQGISDVFDVRVAGNIADPASVASLVYAVEVLGVDLLTVMGHSNCGAVKAAIDASMGKLEAGEFAPLIDAIEPAVATAMPTSNSGEQLQKTIEANARVQAEALSSSSPALAEAVQAGRLTIVPTVYDLPSGRVHVLS